MFLIMKGAIFSTYALMLVTHNCQLIYQMLEKKLDNTTTCCNNLTTEIQKVILVLLQYLQLQLFYSLVFFNISIALCTIIPLLLCDFCYLYILHISAKFRPTGNFKNKNASKSSFSPLKTEKNNSAIVFLLATLPKIHILFKMLMNNFL